MTLISRVSGLRKSYDGREVVAGIDLELTPGECFGLLGPNGAGKTTTLRLCLGLTDPDAGSITLLDHAGTARRRARRACASAWCRSSTTSIRISPCARTCWSTAATSA